MPLLFTFISGLFFLIGVLVYKLVKNKNKLSLISISCAGVIIVGLLCFDLLPEIIENDNPILYLFILIGLIILILIDKFIPHHEHHHKENDELQEDHQLHLHHIGVITIIALLLHNFIEGMALYGVSLNDLKSGFLMLLGVGLHNLPFGFQIAAYNKKSSKNNILIFLLVISGFLGGLLFNLFGSFNLLVEGIIIAITTGMLLHIFIFELLKEIVENIRKKETLYGIIIGIVLLIFMNLL